MRGVLSRFAWAACLLGTMSACGSGKPKDKWLDSRLEVFPTSGVITLDGAPLAGATITFRPTGEGVASAGISDDNGTFKMTTYDTFDGATASDFQVAISKFEVVAAPPNYNADTMPQLPPPKLLTPAKFSDFAKSGLSAKVGKGEPNRFEFSLKSK